MLKMLSNLAVNPAMESLVPWDSCTMAFVSHRAVPLDDEGATFHKAKPLFLQSWIDAGLKVCTMCVCMCMYVYVCVCMSICVCMSTYTHEKIQMHV